MPNNRMEQLLRKPREARLPEKLIRGRSKMRMNRIKRTTGIVMLWVLPTALLILLPWSQQVGEWFGHPISVPVHILSILFWTCIAVSATTRNWIWATGSAVAACCLAVIKLAT